MFKIDYKKPKMFQIHIASFSTQCFRWSSFMTHHVPIYIYIYLPFQKHRGLELHCTILREKELQLYTSTGMVGPAAVSSGPLVDAISRWDVRKSHAAEVAYKRQIMNFIAETLQKRRDETEMVERGIMNDHDIQ